MSQWDVPESYARRSSGFCWGQSRPSWTGQWVERIDWYGVRVLESEILGRTLIDHTSYIMTTFLDSSDLIGARPVVSGATENIIVHSHWWPRRVVNQQANGKKLFSISKNQTRQIQNCLIRNESANCATQVYVDSKQVLDRIVSKTKTLNTEQYFIERNWEITCINTPVSNK